jgi:heat shock protein HslJ
VKPKFGTLICGTILLLLLVGCGQPTVQEVTPWPTPTLSPAVTLPATATPVPVRDPLNNTRWTLVSLYGEPPLEGTHITLEFSGGFIRGFTGCNKYDSRQQIGDAQIRGQYKATEDGSLDTPGVTHTLAASLTPEVNDQEHAYLKALANATSFRLVENRLELQDPTGETTLVFTRW